jgi:hypothetical protein
MRLIALGVVLLIGSYCQPQDYSRCDIRSSVPFCHNVEDGELIIAAKTGKDAMQQVQSRTLTCDFCSAEIPACIGTLDVEAA